jgi:flagellar basal body-associated protein FliL
MKKRGLIWIATGSVIVMAITIVLLLTGQSNTQLGKAKVDKLTEGKAIAVESRAESFGVLKGDAFLYYVDVLYDPEQVSEIDTDSLIESINLNPFEVRSIQESEFKLDDGTFVHRITYELQLIDGDVNYLYDFPSIVARYKLSGSDGFQEMPASAESVYVSSRLPESDEDFVNLSYIDLGYEAPLRALKGEILETGQSSLPWILIACGGLLAIGAVVDLTVMVIPQKKRDKNRTSIEKNKQVAQVYRSLHKNIENGASPDNILYQIDHFIRLVLFRNEHLDWLEELNINRIPADIREETASLFNNISKIGKDIAQEGDIKNSLQYMDKILRFYYQEAVDSWKD